MEKHYITAESRKNQKETLKNKKWKVNTEREENIYKNKKRECVAVKVRERI